MNSRVSSLTHVFMSCLCARCVYERLCIYNAILWNYIRMCEDLLVLFLEMFLLFL